MTYDFFVRHFVISSGGVKHMQRVRAMATAVWSANKRVPIIRQLVRAKHDSFADVLYIIQGAPKK